MKTVRYAICLMATWSLLSLAFAQSAYPNQRDTEFQKLHEEISRLRAQVATLAELLVKLEENSVLKLDGKLKFDPTTSTVHFTGVNVQITNGAGRTATLNGLGNLVVGYNETELTAPAVCSDGQWQNEADCESNSSIWASNQHTGSHNLVIGAGQSFPSYGGFIAGRDNAINQAFSTVSAGTLNIASGAYSSVTGGSSNIASGEFSTATGGNANLASGQDSSVNGGSNNIAAGPSSIVSGGSQNSAGGFSTNAVFGGIGNTAASYIGGTVFGGANNKAEGKGTSTVVGGTTNVATGYSSTNTVVGGSGNSATANGGSSTVTGGSQNAASGTFSSVSGGIGLNVTTPNGWAAGTLSSP